MTPCMCLSSLQCLDDDDDSCNVSFDKLEISHYCTQDTPCQPLQIERIVSINTYEDEKYEQRCQFTKKPCDTSNKRKQDNDDDETDDDSFVSANENEENDDYNKTEDAKTTGFGEWLSKFGCCTSTEATEPSLLSILHNPIYSDAANLPIKRKLLHHAKRFEVLFEIWEAQEDKLDTSTTRYLDAATRKLCKRRLLEENEWKQGTTLLCTQKRLENSLQGLDLPNDLLDTLFEQLEKQMAE